MVINKKAIKKLFKENGKQIGENQLETLDREIKRNLFKLFSIMRNFKRVKDEEIFLVFK